MSTAAPSQTCACGCGNAVRGRKFLNARHKERAAPPKPKTYPHYISAELREVLCRHGNVETQYQKHWHGIAGADWMTLVACPECAAEETARLERLKPKPSSNPCENLTCSCPVPKCPTCRQPMQRGPNPSRGWHSWVCGDGGYYPIEYPKGYAPPGITAVPTVQRGHNEVRETTWRDSCR